ncbi:hypothetical protein [Actinomadura madurae]|uniref:hypothetical protein n=1 Tax=Actinomadura madurae TaxID=1993 RepID=UPI003FD8020B
MFFTASAVDPSNVSAQSPPCRTNASPRPTSASCAFSWSHSPGEDERRLGRQFHGDLPDLVRIVPFGLLVGGEGAPGVELPR